MDIPNNISNIRPIPEAKHNAVFVDFVENFNELHISHEEMKNIPKIKKYVRVVVHILITISEAELDSIIFSIGLVITVTSVIS